MILFYERLINLRESAGYSQRTLARKSGLSAAAISLLESGDRKPRLSTALAISDALNISIDTLVRGRSGSE